MNKFPKAVIVALLFGGSISTASAGGVITGVTATGLSGDSFNFTLNGADHTLDISKVLDSINPVTLTFTVSHTDSNGGSPYAVTESVTNNTGQTWTDFHYSITEPGQGNGVVFTSFNQSTFGNFTLDSEPSSGPRNLNFTGTLASGNSADATFSISPFDPGAGNTTTFSVTQAPSVSAIPEPETYAMMMAGLLLMGSIVKRRSNKA
jgi:hypothetical protein